uniref:(northern house mosquito) hypothetical protein n=1 Tax=Culex pipiens TaxID=7175 RepID=A0A8D8JU60_CULPI
MPGRMHRHPNRPVAQQPPRRIPIVRPLDPTIGPTRRRSIGRCILVQLAQIVDGRAGRGSSPRVERLPVSPEIGETSGRSGATGGVADLRWIWSRYERVDAATFSDQVRHRVEVDGPQVVIFGRYDVVDAGGEAVEGIA